MVRTEFRKDLKGCKRYAYTIRKNAVYGENSDVNRVNGKFLKVYVLSCQENPVNAKVFKYM